MTPARTAPEIYWRTRARTLARAVNAGWWWDRLTPALVGINLTAAAALVLYRQMHWPVLSWMVGLGVAWLAAGLWSLRQARTRFYADAEGLLRLETHLGWHNRLSAAAAGGAAWPTPASERIDPVRWRLQRTSGPLLFSAVFLLLGTFVPVGSGAKANLPPPTQPPAALRQVETLIETLKEEKIVEPTALQNWDERAMELRLKPSREWYGQEGLEAAEALRDQMSQEADTLGKNLAKAAALANAMAALNPEARPAEMNGAMEAILSNLQNGGLPLSQALAAGMASVANLTPEQLKQLAQQLQQAAKGASPGAGSTLSSLSDVMSALGKNNGGGAPSSAPAQGVMLKGQAGGGGDGQASPFISTGGVKGEYASSATALTFGTPTDLKANKVEGVSNPNMNAPVPGETVGITMRGSSKPDEQQDALNGPSGGGQAGAGGDAVWLQDLTPQERTVIKRYFQ